MYSVYFSSLGIVLWDNFVLHIYPPLCANVFGSYFLVCTVLLDKTQSVPAETPTMFVDSFVLRQLFSLIVYYFGISSSSTIFGVKKIQFHV